MRQYLKGFALSAVLAVVAAAAGSWSTPASALRNELHNCFLEMVLVSSDGGVTYSPQLYIICDEGVWFVG